MKQKYKIANSKTVFDNEIFSSYSHTVANK